MSSVEDLLNGWNEVGSRASTSTRWHSSFFGVLVIICQYSITRRRASFDKWITLVSVEVLVSIFLLHDKFLVQFENEPER